MNCRSSGWPARQEVGELLHFETSERIFHLPVDREDFDDGSAARRHIRPLGPGDLLLRAWRASRLEEQDLDLGDCFEGAHDTLPHLGPRQATVAAPKWWQSNRLVPSR